ncbi:MFS transporter [Halobacteriales archaeon QS_1_68_17]|nr:MAG: MFS transporter [Halobacteriales archaeon QS_1_68_17]
MDEGSQTVGDAIDEIPLGRFHRRLFLITGVLWAAMAVSVLGISFVLPTLIARWNLSGFAAGVLGSASLAGMMVGNTAGGWYADRAGRKRTLVVTVTVFPLFTALTALAVGLYSAVVLRFLTGVGLGGALVAGATYLAEYFPTENRGRYVTYLEAFFSVGSLVTVAAAWLVLRRLATDGTVWNVAAWRLYFAAGGIPILLALAIYWYLPASPYFLASKGRTEAATERLASVARENDAAAPSVGGSLSVGRSDEAGLRRLFDVDLRGTTLLMAGLWFGVNLAYYGIFTWLPSTVQAAGYVDSLYRYLFVVAVFQLLGQVSAAYLIEVIGRKWTVGSYMLLGGAATYLFASAIPDGTTGTGDQTLFTVGLFAMGFALFGAWAVLYAYTAEIFPTEVRSSGLGFAGTVGKVAATAGPVLFGTLVQFGYLAALAPVTVVLVVAGLVLLAVGRETKDRTLI